MELSNIFVPAIVSVITALITVSYKSSRDRKNYEEKLKLDHSLSEQRKIKESIAKYKVHMINACEELSNRFKSLMLVHEKKWHHVNGNYLSDDRYYFNSFVYRFASVIWWSNKVEMELVYLDTTVAEREDLDFIKFCKKFSSILCQAKLFKGLDYDDSKETDHFFKHKLISQASKLNDNNSFIVEYSAYENDLSQYIKGMKGICKFIDGISPNEERYRWARIYCMQLLNAAFLNTYGYDFQQIDGQMIQEIVTSISGCNNGDIILNNFIELIKDYKLNENHEVSKLINTINA